MKFHTEAGDQTQYLTREYNDNTIRFIIRYSGVADKEALRSAAEILIQRILILHSSFHAGTWGTKWIVNETYETDEAVVVQEVSGDVFEAAKQASLQAVDYSGAVQIRCFLFYNQSESALAFLVGHMCADGRDAVYLLLKLCEVYGALHAGKTTEHITFKNGDRSIEQCYPEDPQKLTIDLKKIIEEKTNYIKSSYDFPTEEPGEHRMAECLIPGERIARCRSLAKGSTVNDVILTAYCRAYVRQMQLQTDTPIGIASMMDLRKYIPQGSSEGVANLSGPADTCLPNGIGPDFTGTLHEIAKQTRKVKNTPTAGLEELLAIKKVYKVVPFPLILQLGKKVYGSMSIGLTNLGNIKRADLQLGTCRAEDLIFAGPLKKKPALQISASGLDGDVRLCVISQCTKQDQEQLEELLKMTASEIERQ